MLVGLLLDYGNDFDAYVTDSFSGTDGWQSNYGSDPWSTMLNGGVYAKTDDAGTAWGDGSSSDNSLVYTGSTWSDFTLDATLYSADDDALGVVFRFQDTKDFYLLQLTGGDAYADTTGLRSTSAASSRLYVVSGGVGTELASSTTSYTYATTHDVEIVATGSGIDVWFDDDANGVYEPGDLLFSVTDSTFSSGEVGFWCLDDGNATAGCTFDDLTVSLPDADDDGVADYDDDCPADADATQDDLDGDGLGDVCDSDADGDGYDVGSMSSADCDDADAAVHPGVVEVCDGVDQDCDGWIDDGTDCFDDDGDGYDEIEGDCDDADAGVNPGATDVPGDGIDQDCDGSDATVVDTGDTGATDTGDTGAMDTADTATTDTAGSDTGDSGAVDTDTGGDTDVDTDAVNGRTPSEKDDVVLATGCGCDSGGGAGWTALLGALVALGRRRR